MLDKFRHVLNKVVLPQYPAIVEMRLREDKDFPNLIILNVILSEKVEAKELQNIHNDIDSLFHMITATMEDSVHVVDINFKLKETDEKKIR